MQIVDSQTPATQICHYILKHEKTKGIINVFIMHKGYEFPPAKYFNYQPKYYIWHQNMKNSIYYLLSVELQKQICHSTKCKSSSDTNIVSND